MNSLMKGLLSGMSLLLAVNVSAKNFKIVSVKSDFNKKVYDLYIEGNSADEAKSLKLLDIGTKEWTKFNVKNLDKGAVILKQKKHNIIVLKSKDFEVDRGGHFKVDYLKNGLSGVRGAINIKLDFDGKKWKALHKGEKVKSLNFKVKKVLRKPVGIKKVIVK